MTKSLLSRAFQNVGQPDLLHRRFVSTPSGIPPQSDMVSQMQSMSSVPTLFAIVDRLATSTASVDWKIYRTSGKEREQIDKHPALSVLNRPNEFYTQREFLEASVQHYDLTGEMWWVIGRADNYKVPLELWPVRPDRMRPVSTGTSFLSGYVYKGVQDVPLAREDVIFTKRQSPLDPHRGISPVGALLYDLEGEKAAAAYNAMFFKNGATPGGIIEADEFLSDTEFEQMTTRWREQHQGVRNAHRVAVLEKAKFHELRYTNRDMEFVELRRYTKEQIRQAYGFPKPLLGDVEDVNRANAEAAEVVFSRWLINPRLDLIKDALNTRFLPMFGSLGKGYEFDYEDPAPEDAEGRRNERGSAVSAAVQLINVGFDPAESLKAFGLPEVTFLGSPNVGTSF